MVYNYGISMVKTKTKSESEVMILSNVFIYHDREHHTVRRTCKLHV